MAVQDVQSLGLVATPEKAFWDRGASPAPLSGNPMHSADGHTLADAPGLTPRPGEQAWAKHILVGYPPSHLCSGRVVALWR